METILLSIKPEYAELILAGTKQFEYRKRLATKPVEKIIIYETEPTMLIVGEVTVIETISGPPDSLWERTKERGGISPAKYQDYFMGCDTACAYHLGKVKRYRKPKKLSDFNIQHPPQSFVYITKNGEQILFSSEKS